MAKRSLPGAVQTWRIASLTPESLALLTGACAACTFWESAPGRTAPSTAEWLSQTSLDWGVCGQYAELDGRLVGHVRYAPPGYVPRAPAFPTAPPSPDAVLLVALRVEPEVRGVGLGRALVRAAAADLVTRGVRALEAYGSASPTGCLLPTDFLRAVGFTVVRPHPMYPRLRLDLRSTLTWRDDVEGAWSRLRYFGTRSGSRIDPVGVSSSSGR